MKFPDDLNELKVKIQDILNPIASVEEKNTRADKNFLFNAMRTDAGRSLPPYYLVYFLFVDLLNYKNLGQFEKISWSVPIDFKGTAYLLEHRKFGMGLFAENKESQEIECKVIVSKITRAIKAAQPYFEWRANEAAKRSDLNVLNHSLRLHERYVFLLSEYKNKLREAESKKDVRIHTQYSSSAWGVSTPYYQLKREAAWLAISAIDAFYSFTEHVFIHAAILKSEALTGEEVARLAEGQWASKFKSCLDIRDNNVKPFYDKLVEIKRQIRNYVAHGAFGKNGEAFQVHSGAGAVPLLLPHQKGSSRFSMHAGIDFKEEDAIRVIEDFMNYYWEEDNFPEIIYVRSDLPTILPYASDSTYEKAMESVQSMRGFTDYLTGMFENSANMDW